jgi:hypothetical protein
MDSPMPDPRDYARALRLVLTRLWAWLRRPAPRRRQDDRSEVNSRMQVQ